jgi:small subunit ribosomal protein S21
MIIIDLKKEKSIESALKTYKNKIQKTKQIQKLRERKEFVKPSVTRREEILKAKYIQQIKNGLN